MGGDGIIVSKNNVQITNLSTVVGGNGGSGGAVGSAGLAGAGGKGGNGGTFRLDQQRQGENEVRMVLLV